MKLIDPASMREVDERAGREYGLPGLCLMENAGAAVARRACAMLGGARDRRVVVVAGSGNNGGDGMVAARHLANRGARVRVLLAADGGAEEPRLSPDALVNHGVLVKMGVEVLWVDESNRRRLELALNVAELVVDAVLGTGSHGAPRGRALMAIEMMTAAGRPVLAVDVPSGVDASSGQVPGKAVRARETVTLALAKPGLVMFPGASYCGRVTVADIGFPGPLIESAPAALELVELPQVAAWLPDRPPDGHKGTFGHVLVVAGSRGMIGAGALAARAAALAGAGLVTWAMPASLQDTAAGMVPEVLTAALPEGEKGRAGRGAVPVILELLSRRDVLLIGPGLGTAEETAQAVMEVLRSWSGPTVVDADALNILAASGPGTQSGPVFSARTVVTPHPGEMARLIGEEVALVQADRVGAVREAIRRFGCVAVLKGARTLVGLPDGRLFLNPAASAALATGGSGDVLSGVIAGLWAQGVEAPAAAAAGTYVHSLAGVLAAGGGDAGVTAQSIAAQVGEAIRRITRLESPPEALCPVIPET